MSSRSLIQPRLKSPTFPPLPSTYLLREPILFSPIRVSAILSPLSLFQFDYPTFDCACNIANALLVSLFGPSLRNDIEATTFNYSHRIHNSSSYSVQRNLYVSELAGMTKCTLCQAVFDLVEYCLQYLRYVHRDKVKNR